MNRWTQASIALAGSEDYLDRLYEIYPTDAGEAREIGADALAQLRRAYEEGNDAELIAVLLDMPLFPIKDSYVAFLRKDRGAIRRNPQTVQRLAAQVYEMGMDTVLREMRRPKEANRRMGQHFINWKKSAALGLTCLPANEFRQAGMNCQLDGSDSQLADFARAELNYASSNGLDFVAKYNNRYVIGEAKFLTESGGQQNRQFESACRIFGDPASATKVVIADGVLYLPSRDRMHRYLHDNPTHHVLSALLLSEYLQAATM